jgi:ribosomal protein S18 acetylase RimI-like enzyme
MLSLPAVTVRLARLEDLRFVTSDGHAASDVVRRKISHGEVFVAERDGEPLGYLRLEYLWSRLPYIAMIQVASPHRRQGVGRALLAHLARALVKQGHAILYSSSQADEPEAQAWHRRVGFEECGIVSGINEGGIGEVFFRKPLP